MTDERKNEIWAMLTKSERAYLINLYNTDGDWEDFNKGCNLALETVFGFHNLTAQAGEGNHNLSQFIENYDKSNETTQESPSHSENEPNLGVSERETTQKSPSEPKFKRGDKVVVFGQLAVVSNIHDNGYDVEFQGDHLDPIPLTAELLTEIGFEHIDKTLYVKDFDVSHIALSLVSNGLWRVQEYDNVVCHSTMLCRYLHELENFVYMTLHKELIED